MYQSDFKRKQVKSARIRTLIFLALATVAYATGFTAISVQATGLRDDLQAQKLTVEVRGVGKGIETREMRITYYGWTGNMAACGRYPKIGDVATSDRTIPFGTKVYVGGKEYEVCDRTNKRIAKMGDTIDIYSDLSHEELIKLGTYNTKVILKYE